MTVCSSLPAASKLLPRRFSPASPTEEARNWCRPEEATPQASRLKSSSCGLAREPWSTRIPARPPNLSAKAVMASDQCLCMRVTEACATSSNSSTLEVCSATCSSSCLLSPNKDVSTAMACNPGTPPGNSPSQSTVRWRRSLDSTTLSALGSCKLLLSFRMSSFPIGNTPKALKQMMPSLSPLTSTLRRCCSTLLPFLLPAPELSSPMTPDRSKAGAVPGTAGGRGGGGKKRGVRSWYSMGRGAMSVGVPASSAQCMHSTGAWCTAMVRSKSPFSTSCRAMAPVWCPTASALPSGRQQMAVARLSGTMAHSRCQLNRCTMSWCSRVTMASRSLSAFHAASSTAPDSGLSSSNVKCSPPPPLPSSSSAIAGFKLQDPHGSPTTLPNALRMKRR